jgi:mono/diheme cytochrome c family protein
MSRLLPLIACALLAGCGQEMDSQPKYTEYEKAPLFRDGRVLQVPAPGTVARDEADRLAEASEKPPLTTALLQRGHEEFDIFCSPCHGRTGAGNGMIVQRGMPQPPDFHGQRLRDAPDQHIFDTITKGYGVMYSYAARIAPRDRWAIVAYLRALQLSAHATLADVPPPERERLMAEKSR